MKIAIDIGGTFIDLLATPAHGAPLSLKLPAQPKQLIAGLTHGLEQIFDRLGEREPIDEVFYSTTFALNSLLTHALPPIGLVVNRGFREMMETARLPLPDDSPSPTLTPRLVALEHVREIDGRLDASGSEDQPLDKTQIEMLADEYLQLGIDVIAVSLLHSYLDDVHEQQVAEFLRAHGPALTVVPSSDVLPALREYERTLATCLNACLMPSMASHLDELNRVSNCRYLWVMKSDGALALDSHARQRPLQRLLPPRWGWLRSPMHLAKTTS